MNKFHYREYGIYAQEVIDLKEEIRKLNGVIAEYQHFHHTFKDALKPLHAKWERKMGIIYLKEKRGITNT